MPDHHHRGDRLWHGANALEQLVCGGGIQLGFYAHRRGRRERGAHKCERLARALSGGAEDKLRRDFEPDEVLGDPLRVPPASPRQRPLSVSERLISPTGFRMPEEVESVNRSAPLGLSRRAASECSAGALLALRFNLPPATSNRVLCRGHVLATGVKLSLHVGSATLVMKLSTEPGVGAPDARAIAGGTPGAGAGTKDN